MKPHPQTFHLPFEFSYDNDYFTDSLPDAIEEKQRTEKWHEDRKGKFTGSKTKDLMSCSAVSKKMDWNNDLKIIDFGDTAKKYIYSRAMERKRNIVLERSIGQNGTYGTKAEKRIVELIQIKYPELIIEDVGFKEYIKDIAGASPDGLIKVDLLKSGLIKSGLAGLVHGDKIGLEIKAATNYDGVYNRIETPFVPKHDDFWQIQSEMLALEVNKLLYVIAEPPKDLKKPETIKFIQDKIIEASPFHQKAIIERCMIGNRVIDLFLSGKSFSDSLVLGIDEWFSRN